MIDGTVAKRYAKALFEVANEKNQLDEVEQDLQFIVKIMNDTKEFITFLSHPQIEGKSKKELIDASFKNNLTVTSKNLFYQLIDNHRVELLEEIMKIYINLANEVRGIVDVEATTAAPLESDEKNKIIATLTKRLGKKVRLENIVNPSVVGGIIIKMGDRVYNGSINEQLRVLKRGLTASRV